MALSEERLDTLRRHVESTPETAEVYKAIDYMVITASHEETALAALDAVATSIDRLRAENAAMREVVEAVADEQLNYCHFYCRASDGRDGYKAGEIVHAPRCPVTKARALLAKEGEA